jgi:NAD(P)-dependent dehydrogenase (short-subunit alcohol dehydrogenase family)
MWFARPDIPGQHERRVTLERVAQLEEMAGAVIHLISEEASYTTGAILLIDGGYTLT